WSNAGLVVDQGESLLVDTLFDLRLTQEMLVAMRRATDDAKHIKTLVNTHANQDHCNGNELVGADEIISSTATYREMAQDDPDRLVNIMRNTPNMGSTGEFLQRCFGKFDFEGITMTLPNRTFDELLEVSVGDKTLRLKRVGPCHTQGDILVHCVEDRLMFTGDILFIEGHPILWVGPVANWISACDYMLELDLETIVPGHGPITDKDGVRAVRDYLVYIRDEAYARFRAGMSVYDAAMDISLSQFEDWGDSERIGVNVQTLYREFGDQSKHQEPFSLMAQIDRDRRSN
ncbi:MAG: MBL fold metallo-hydrolase, partial [Gammaproteobacteria bacterium]|nr:MBL fold metallo-hydrolase [Gammaproteobacteria bacterium]